MALPERAPDDAGAPVPTRVLKVRLSLKGRPIKSFRFKQEAVMVGRDPDADIFLDNPGVSRHHLRIVSGARGYYEVEDQGSANGSILNEKRLSNRPEVLMNNDVIHIGKFSLWVTYDEERRGRPEDIRTTPPSAFQGTTVLSTQELETLVAGYREGERDRQRAGRPADAAPWPEPAPRERSRSTLAVVAAVAFLVGLALGGSAIWLLIR